MNLFARDDNGNVMVRNGTVCDGRTICACENVLAVRQTAGSGV